MKNKKRYVVQYEVEIKCLLDSRAKVDRLVKRLSQDANFKKLGHNTLLNHYFDCQDIEKLRAVAPKLLKGLDLDRLNDVLNKSGVISLRTRGKNDEVWLIAKGVPAGGDAVHGSSRMEFEAKVDVPLSVLDKALVDAGMGVMSKWSGYKDVYSFNDVLVEIQFSAGYGFMVEIEKLVSNKAESAKAEKRVREVATELGLKEVDHDLITNMYKYYEVHWPEYYGTDKIFDHTIFKQLSSQ